MDEKLEVDGGDWDIGEREGVVNGFFGGGVG